MARLTWRKLHQALERCLEEDKDLVALKETLDVHPSTRLTAVIEGQGRVTPLIWALEHERMDIFHLLLDRGATPDGDTLNRACWGENFEAVQIMKERYNEHVTRPRPCKHMGPFCCTLAWTLDGNAIYSRYTETHRKILMYLLRSGDYNIMDTKSYKNLIQYKEQHKIDDMDRVRTALTVASVYTIEQIEGKRCVKRLPPVLVRRCLSFLYFF